MRSPQESTLSFLLYFFGTCSCTPSELPDSRRLFGTRKFLPLSLFNELLNLLHLFGVCFIRLHSSVSHYQKVTPSFLNRLLRIHPKILSEVSMNLFLRPPCGSCRTPVSERDCKGTPFFLTTKLFSRNFSTFFGNICTRHTQVTELPLLVFYFAEFKKNCKKQASCSGRTSFHRK